MSRIGKQPVVLNSVTLEVIDGLVLVRGSKGELKVTIPEGINLSVEDGIATVTRISDEFSAFHGLFRSLLFNAVKGVSEGWERILEINGVGMKAALTGSSITLNLGFSHPIIFDIPEGIQAQVTKNQITISGIDKQLVGEVAAQIRKLKKPEPYKGKGIKYSDEKVRRKAGKTGKAGK